MRSPIHLEPYLNVQELKSNYRKAQNVIEARRWQILFLVAQKWTIKDAADVVGISYEYAKRIIQRYNKQGPDSIKDRCREKKVPVGRSLLNPEQEEELQELLKYPPQEGGKWSGAKVAKWIESKTGRQAIWPQRGCEYLKKLGNR